MGPILALFNFTMRQTLLHRRVWLAVLILAAPCVLHVAIRAVAPPIDEPQDMWEVYHVSALFLLMSVLIPLVCMVYGTALVGADVEAGTMVYLITRRMRRATVLLVKFVATSLVLAVLCAGGCGVPGGIQSHWCAYGQAGRRLGGLSRGGRVDPEQSPRQGKDL